MRSARILLAACLLAMGSWMSGSPAKAAEPDYRKSLQEIARQIQALGSEYPQLADFSKTGLVDLDRLVIEYQFHTHAPQRTGGWTSGVPNPDEDGIWFHIDIHDPDSQAQIHTQPVVRTAITLGKKVALLLMLEGRKNKPAEGRIWEIVERVARNPLPAPVKQIDPH